MLTGQNVFASGGLLLMVIGGMSVYLRAVPERLWHWIVGQTTMLITVKDDDAAFVWVKEWFLDQKFLARIRRVDLDTTMRSERVALIPAPGSHWFWYGGRPYVVYFHRSNESRERTSRRTESLTFRTIGRSRSVLQRFVDDVVASHVRSMGAQSLLFAYNDGWNRIEGYSPRLLDSVILQPGEREHLVQDVGNSGSRSDDTRGWVFLTIGATSFMDPQEQVRRLSCRRWRRISDSRFTPLISPFSTTGV